MKDKLTVRAISEGYRARSVYKIQEINNKFRIISKNDKVLDIGAWPGSWIQFCLNLTKNITGIDKKRIKKLDNVNFISADIFHEDILDKINSKFDVVISDIAPNTTGIKELDVSMSYDLSMRSLYIAKNVLVENGNFICKIFQGDDMRFMNEVKKYFKYVKFFKPKSSKKRSREIYLIAKSFKI